MIEFLYQIVAGVAGALAAPLFLCSRRGRAGLGERLGSWKFSPGRPVVWFHGASAGEINGLLPLIQCYREGGGSAGVLVTSTTTTGVDRARGVADWARLLPFDSAIYLRRALGSAQFERFISAETELWPGLLAVLSAKKIPAYLVNARLSDYSIRWYRMLRPLLRRPLASFTRILCATDVSKERFIELGAPKDRIATVGNSKYDQQPSISDKAEALRLKAEFFDGEVPVLVLGSLRPGEEQLWFRAIRASFDSGSSLGVIVAPRHKEKFEYFAGALEQAGIPFVRRSQQGAAGTKPAVVLLDTFGELERVYSFADLVFIGASLVDVGGHNPLEPAAYGAAVSMGPFTRNVADIVEALDRVGGLIAVRDLESIATVVSRMVAGDPALAVAGAAAKTVWESQIGAAKRLCHETGLVAPR